MAGTNYSYQKHMKELARKKKKEEKMRLKLDKKLRLSQVPVDLPIEGVVNTEE